MVKTVYLRGKNRRIDFSFMAGISWTILAAFRYIVHFMMIVREDQETRERERGDICIEREEREQRNRGKRYR